MKRTFIFTFIVFCGAFLLGLAMHINWKSCLVRAVCSGAFVFMGKILLVFLIRHFLPELLAKEEPFSSDSSAPSSKVPSSSVGKAVDITVGDDLYTAEQDPLQEDVTDPSITLPLTPSTQEQKKVPFTNQDPAILAKMVRTTLEKDNNQESA